VVAVEAVVAPVVVAVVAPVAEAFAPVAVAPVAVAPVAVAPVAVAPVAVAPVAVAPVAVAPVADLATLHAIVRAAGLQWVESDPARVAETLAQQPSVTVKLGRERKPTVTLSSDPLVQVETRG
jgi:ribonuclease E